MGTQFHLKRVFLGGLEPGWGQWLMAQSEKLCGTQGQSYSSSPADGCMDQGLSQK